MNGPAPWRLLSWLASTAIACGGGGGTEAPCESDRYTYCFETFAPADSASVAENPETTVRFQQEDDGLDVLAFLDVPEGVQSGELEVAFGGGADHVQVQLSIGEETTFWGDSGRVTIERHDERIVGFGRAIVLDESLRDPEDGDRLAYLGRIEFDVEIENQGD